MTENRSLMRRLFEPKSLDHQAPAAKFVTYALLFIWSRVVLIPLYWVLITAFKNQGDVANGPFYLPFIDFQPKTDAGRGWSDSTSPWATGAGRRVR